jgi:ADP-ribose pyrophosphatase
MDLFVYGTLTSHSLMAAVAGPGSMMPMPSQLHDYVVYPLAGNVVPFIAPTAGRQAEGLVWQDLSAAQMSRLDAYEGAFGYSFGPVEVQTAAGSRIAQAYLPHIEMAAGVGKWSLADWEAGHLTPAVLAVQELFSLNPMPDYAQLRAMWPMIEARAWAKFRAAAAPATRRFHAKAEDFTVVQADPPAGQFFRFQSTKVSHRQFNGTRSDVLTREGFLGVDAAVILPYDPVRDRVILVEQARLGPALRRDPNPWMLEPIAGIIDARETPQGAALREAKEEAGLTITTLECAGAFYVSPGCSTDYFYTFVGVCDLPQDAPYLGGLPDEAEDLRLHPLGFDSAMDLADQGEIATGPALYLLYWLLRHRDRLRAAV